MARILLLFTAPRPVGGNRIEAVLPLGRMRTAWLSMGIVLAGLVALLLGERKAQAPPPPDASVAVIARPRHAPIRTSTATRDSA